jgi:hypothetical protein
MNTTTYQSGGQAKLSLEQGHLAVIIPEQPSPFDVWAADEVVKLITKAFVFTQELISCFAAFCGGDFVKLI